MVLVSTGEISRGYDRRKSVVKVSRSLQWHGLLIELMFERSADSGKTLPDDEPAAVRVQPVLLHIALLGPQRQPDVHRSNLRRLKDRLSLSDDSERDLVNLSVHVLPTAQTEVPQVGQEATEYCFGTFIVALKHGYSDERPRAIRLLRKQEPIEFRYTPTEVAYNSWIVALPWRSGWNRGTVVHEPPHPKIHEQVCREPFAFRHPPVTQDANAISQ
jgi:hypothetical protein